MGFSICGASRLSPAMMPRNSTVSPRLKFPCVLHTSNPTPCFLHPNPQSFFSPSALLFVPFVPCSPAFDLNVSGLKYHLCENAVLLLCMITDLWFSRQKESVCNPHVLYFALINCSLEGLEDGHCLGLVLLSPGSMKQFWFGFIQATSSKVRHTHTQILSFSAWSATLWMRLSCSKFFHKSVHNMTAFKV